MTSAKCLPNLKWYLYIFGYFQSRLLVYFTWCLLYFFKFYLADLVAKEILNKNLLNLGKIQVKNIKIKTRMNHLKNDSLILHIKS